MSVGKFRDWWNGDLDITEHLMDESEEPNLSRERLKEIQHEQLEKYLSGREVQRTVRMDRRAARGLYLAMALVSLVVLVGVLLYVVSRLPRYGVENPATVEVVKRYVEHGLEETGAVNVVAGMILDYRAFDTLGETHVLFTALICVMVLLRIDAKNMRTDFEDYYTIQQDVYFDLSADPILKTVCSVLVPAIMLFGVYVVLNGQLSPGGGFSGGAILGAGMILFSCAYGFKRADRFLTGRLVNWMTFLALAFYSFAKGYVFFTGANGLENHIPKGVPGAILSGGMILPLDIAVGLVVGCTMYSFYSLFKRGDVGANVDFAKPVE